MRSHSLDMHKQLSGETTDPNFSLSLYLRPYGVCVGGWGGGVGHSLYKCG